MHFAPRSRRSTSVVCADAPGRPTGDVRASSVERPSRPGSDRGEGMSRTVVTVDALVVGAGPAGLAAATALRSGGAGTVMVLDREDEAGGIPRLCEHTGFGLRDLRRVLSGPAYARRWVERAVACGVDIRTRTMVTGWAAPGRAEVTGPGGVLEMAARTIVLATGARERPRAARLVPGTRPSGIFTTGQLQQWVHREHLPVGRRAVIVGAEHVSYSAAMTLRRAGVRPVALVTELPRPQTYRLFDLLGRFGLRVPVWTETSVAGVYGRDRVEGVLVRGPGGDERSVAVDTVVFTGDFIPDSELARLAGLSHRSRHPRSRVYGRRRDDRPGDLRGRQRRAPGRDRGCGRTAGPVRRPGCRGMAAPRCRPRGMARDRAGARGGPVALGGAEQNGSRTRWRTSPS